ncbi:MAG: thioredoxin-like domain-containing protein [Deltaproteobacteria bacterium]
MTVARMRLCLWVCLCLTGGVGTGCGKSDAPPTADGAAADDAAPRGLPTVAIGAPKKAPARAVAEDDDDEDDDADDEKDDADDSQPVVAPKKGTAEWLVHEATRLRLEPPPKTEDVEVLKKHRQERNERIVQLSQKAIEQIQNDKDKERLFNAAVHNLLQARLQRALTGHAESIDLLYQDAAALYKRDPKSQAAAEGTFTLVNLAYGLAQSSTVDKARWIKEFAVQAQHFAEDFRKDESRSLPLLFSAGRSCELAGMTAEALDCYTLIQKGYPKSAFAPRAAPIVKRLKLPGNPAQLSGPTIDGDQVAVDDLLGKAVLVVFWSAEVKPCLEQLPKILAVTRKQSKRGLYVIGVNLDLDAEAVQQFVVKNKIPWPQIFHPETENRGWNNPIVLHYGILDIPALWLIDQSGNVVSTSVKVADLGAEIDKLLGNDADAGADQAGSAKAAGAQSAGVKPAGVKPASTRPADDRARDTILERPHSRASKKSGPASR